MPSVGSMSLNNANLVSIIMPTLDGERFIRQSIDSSLNQSWPEIELIVVDGGSTDETLKIVADYADPRIRLIHQPPDSGRLPGAINLGCRHASGSYLTWTHDDNWYEPKAIEILVQRLTDHPDVDFVGYFTSSRLPSDIAGLHLL